MGEPEVMNTVIGVHDPTWQSPRCHAKPEPRESSVGVDHLRSDASDQATEVQQDRRVRAMWKLDRVHLRLDSGQIPGERTTSRDGGVDLVTGCSQPLNQLPEVGGSAADSTRIQSEEDSQGLDPSFSSSP